MSNSTTASTTSTDLATSDFEARTTAATLALQDLANELPEELGMKVLQLAQLTQPGIKGMEGTQRAQIPRISLRQPSSTSELIPADCQIGHMYDSTGNSIGDSLNFIPILLHEVRKKWGENQIDCLSPDGVTGTRYGACSECPYGRFEQGQRPECSNGYQFYIVDEEFNAFYSLEFLKSSAKAGRNVKRLLQAPAVWGRSFKVMIEHNTANNRNYYTYKTQATGRRTEADHMKVCEALHEFFQAGYHGYLFAQAEKLRKLAAEAGNNAPIVITDDEEALNFEDSM